MDATALDALFGTGFSQVKQIHFSYLLNRPAATITDDTADVQEQQHVVDIQFDPAFGQLTIQETVNGDGLWIPYLGNGSGGDDAKGWGTYSGNVGNKTWVATGKFSGCSIGMFTGGGGTRFAHLITPAPGHPCASVAAQVAAISAATLSGTVVTYQPPTPVGEAIAFMLLLNGTWHKRIVQVAVGSSAVVAMNTQSTVFA